MSDHLPLKAVSISQSNSKKINFSTEKALDSIRTSLEKEVLEEMEKLFKKSLPPPNQPDLTSGAPLFLSKKKEKLASLMMHLASLHQEKTDRENMDVNEKTTVDKKSDREIEEEIQSFLKECSNNLSEIENYILKNDLSAESQKNKGLQQISEKLQKACEKYHLSSNWMKA